MTKEPKTGTLAELNVKPGDVVEFVRGCAGFDNYAVKYGGRRFEITSEGDARHAKSGCREHYFGADCRHVFRIVSRAAQANSPKLWRDMTPEANSPKLWRDMTPEEKGALLLAHHEGKVIEWTRHPGDTEFRENTAGGGRPVWDDRHAYRIRPEPVWKTVTLYSADAFAWSSLPVTNARWLQTYDLIDGNPDCDSIRMEKL